MKKQIKAIESISKYAKDGDVINFNGHTAWYNLPIKIGFWGIRTAQTELFGKVSRTLTNGIIISPFMDTHSTIYFQNKNIRKHIGENEKVKKILSKEKWGKTFSVEPPVCTFIPVEDYALKEISIYRYTKKKIDDKDIKIMIEGTLPILLTEYDYGQLGQIAINQIAGYPYEQKWDFLDFGSDKKVCSVGVASVYTYWRHQLEKSGIKIPRIFSKLNEKMWDRDFVKKFYEEGKGKWSVEQTYPANFSYSSTYFDNEFELILYMNNGKILYKNI